MKKVIMLLEVVVLKLEAGEVGNVGLIKIKKKVVIVMWKKVVVAGNICENTGKDTTIIMEMVVVVLVGVVVYRGGSKGALGLRIPSKLTVGHYSLLTGE